MLGYLSHVDTVLADAADWRHDPWSGEVHDGAIWGRGAVDMKSQTAAEAVALARLARSGWRPPRGEVKLIAVVDEETGGEHGAQWLTEQRPGRRPRRLAAQRGRRRGDALRRPPPVRRLLRGEGHVPLPRPRPRPRRPRVRPRARRQRAAQAPARARAPRHRPRRLRRRRGAPRAAARALGEDPADPERAIANVRATEPDARRARRADARRDVRADDHRRRHQDQRDPRPAPSSPWTAGSRPASATTSRSPAPTSCSATRATGSSSTGRRPSSATARRSRRR